MAAIGGSIESVDMRGRLFAASADGEVTRKLGGYTNEVQSNGDGSARIIKTREPFSLEGLVLEVDDFNTAQEYLQELANEKDYFPIAITLASGVVYQGSAMIVGDLGFSSQNSTATVSMMGPFGLTQQ